MKKTLAIVLLLTLVALGTWFAKSALSGPRQQDTGAQAEQPSKKQVVSAELANAPDDISTPESNSLERAQVDSSAASNPERSELESGPDDLSLQVTFESLFPTPDDERLAIFVFRNMPSTRTLREDLMQLDSNNLMGHVWAKANGSAKVPLPHTADEDFFLFARGRYGYSTNPVTVRASALPKNEAGQSLLSMPLEMGAWITGEIQTPAGSEAGACAIRLEEVQESATNVFLGTANNNTRSTEVRDGRFELRGVKASLQWNLRATPELLASELVSNIQPHTGQHLDQPIFVGLGAALSGRVIDAEGQPVPMAKVGVEVDAVMFGMGGAAVREGQTDANGLFQLDAVTQGEATLVVEAKGFLDAREEIKVPTKGELSGLEIVMETGKSVAGQVLYPDGTPVMGAEVNVAFDYNAGAGMGGFNAIKGASGEGKTDQEGRFKVEGLGGGPFTVKASAAPPSTMASEASATDSASSSQSANESISKDLYYGAQIAGIEPNTADVLLTLTPPQGIRGRVVDEQGEPVTQFEVLANRIPSTDTLVSIPTDSRRQNFVASDGRFVLNNTPPGQWVLSVAAVGFAQPETMQTTLTPSGESVASTNPEGSGLDQAQTTLSDDGYSEEVLITVHPEAKVLGLVLDAVGQPVAGAQVHLNANTKEALSRALGLSQQPTVQSGPDGSFELRGLHSGNQSIFASHEEWADSELLPLSLSVGDALTNQNLSLRTGGTITGEVFGADGEMAQNIMVIAQLADGRDQQTTQTDSSGFFEFERLKPETFQVIAMLRSFEDVAESGEVDQAALMEAMKFEMVNVLDGSENHIVLGAPPANPVEVTGQVTLDGVGQSGLMVQFLPRTGGLSNLVFTTTGEDGSYHVQVKEAGDYMVVVVQPERSGAASRQIEFNRTVPRKENWELDIELPLGAVSGKVRGPDGPIGATRITLYREGGVPSGSLFGGQYADILTEADGTYTLQWLDPGTYTVSAGGDRFGAMLGKNERSLGRQARHNVVVKKGASVGGVDFTLEPAGSIEGQVLDNLGNPVPEVSIFLREENGMLLERMSFISSDVTGNFEVSGLSKGRYLLEARGKGLTSSNKIEVRVKPGEASPAELSMEAGNWLIVSLLDELGKPIQAEVLVTDPSGHQVNGMMSMQDFIDAFSSGAESGLGEQRIGPLSAGRYSIEAKAPDGRTAGRSMTLRGSGQERKLLLKLKN